MRFFSNLEKAGSWYNEVPYVSGFSAAIVTAFELCPAGRFSPSGYSLCTECPAGYVPARWLITGAFASIECSFKLFPALVELTPSECLQHGNNTTRGGVALRPFAGLSALWALSFLKPVSTESSATLVLESAACVPPVSLASPSTACLPSEQGVCLSAARGFERASVCTAPSLISRSAPFLRCRQVRRRLRRVLPVYSRGWLRMPCRQHGPCWRAMCCWKVLWRGNQQHCYPGGLLHQLPRRQIRCQCRVGDC